MLINKQYITITIDLLTILTIYDQKLLCCKSWINGRSESPVAAATAEEEKGAESFSTTADHE